MQRTRRGNGRAAHRAGTAAGVLLAASLVVAGCSGDSGGNADGKRADKGVAAPDKAPGAGGAAPAPGKPQRPGEGGKQDGGSASRPVRLAPSQIVRTATVTVETKDVPGALAKARTAAEGAGGYVGDESTDRDAEGDERSRVVLRVPPQDYDAVLERLSKLGTLKGRQVSAKDVTDEVVDVDSRIRSQKQSVARVRELMDRASSISDVVALESELSTRQADLESLQARLASLKERTGMATITLVLSEPDTPAAKKQTKDDDGTSFTEALTGGWDAFTTTVRWVLVAVGAVLPFAAAAAVLYALWWLVRTRLVRARLPWRRLRTADGAAPVPAPKRNGPAREEGRTDR